MEEQPFEIYSSDSDATENIIIKKEPVEMYYLDAVKTEIIIKDEHKIEISSANLRFDTITTKQQPVERFLSDSACTEVIMHKDQHVETYFSDSGDANECIMKKSTQDLQLEDMMNESSEDDVFSEGDSIENDPEDIDITKIKKEDIDIEPNNVCVERNLTLEEIKVENAGDENNIVDNCKIGDSIEEQTYEKKVQVATRQTDHINNNRNEKMPEQKQCSSSQFKSSHRSSLKVYQCHECSRTFLRKGGLKRHISSVHLNLTLYICKECKKIFNFKVGLDRHIVSRHQKNLGLMETVTNKIYGCDHCSYMSVSKTVMSSHLDTHETL